MTGYLFLSRYARNSNGRLLRTQCGLGSRNHQPGLRSARPVDRPARIWLTFMPANVTPFCLPKNWKPIGSSFDEVRGRRAAKRRQLQYTGTLGVLAAGAGAGLLNLPSAMDRLRQTSFYIKQALLDQLIRNQP